LNKNTINPNSEIEVKIVSEWDDEYGKEIFEKSGEPWGIDVLKRALLNDNTVFFVAHYKGVPVGMTYCHITDGVCRVDYLLVSTEYRNIGVGRAIINSFVEYCIENSIEICYLWTDGETAEKIYYEAGFRLVQTKIAGRAMYKIG
jgi:GNAT superfamily N-acetyltransferase